MKRLWLDFKQRPLWRKALDMALVLFATAGAAILGAWALYQLGVTKNRGAVDKNYRYLMSVGEMQQLRGAKLDTTEEDGLWAERMGQLAALARLYPGNARLIMQTAAECGDPTLVDRMVSAASIYATGNDTISRLSDEVTALLRSVPQRSNPNVVPWMATPEWEALKQAILYDSALINQAGRLTGVEARLIAGCLIGEQIRLFSSKREVYKRYLGPVKMIVQSQFSHGVNGIKDFTAEAVEEHLRDPQSEYYMGPAYEHLLDFATDNHAEERYRRLVDYGNHLYSYIYTGCILHQTMLQWRRAGYDISDRPDLLFTLFNIGFSQSHPKPDPMPGGSHITVGDREYTFGAIGFDFYYSGELARVFPIRANHFDDNGKTLTADEIELVQGSMTDCRRPERGSEYRRDSLPLSPALPFQEKEEPDPFGIDPSNVVPLDHTAR